MLKALLHMHENGETRVDKVAKLCKRAVSQTLS